MLTKDKIVHLLKTNDQALARALVVLNRNQTVSEQNSQSTINRNGEGFRPCHARMGTSMAEFFTKRGYLSPKQLAYWRVVMKDGNMRIAIYWRQLVEAAEAKQAAKAVKSVANSVPVAEVDYGNAAEEEMVRQEIEAHQSVQTHPDEAEMQRMEAEHDREQSRKEEWLKAIRKGYIEQPNHHPKFSNTRL